ncbi:Sarcoplasmic/Endoplasmic Reticulum Calcium Atpase 1 [Manis pentadactyla]|nr:Sarcoplasmic/Endoplasmic Reticulum Calcium Atpase 1 [Manis pentadactyla]
MKLIIQRNLNDVGKKESEEPVHSQEPAEEAGALGPELMMLPEIQGVVLLPLLPAHLLWVLQPPNLLSNHLLQDHLLPANLCGHLLPAHLLPRSLLPALLLWVHWLWTDLLGVQLLPALPPPNLLSNQLLQDHVLPADLCGLLLPAHLLWV